MNYKEFVNKLDKVLQEEIPVNNTTNIDTTPTKPMRKQILKRKRRNAKK